MAYSDWAESKAASAGSVRALTRKQTAAGTAAFCAFGGIVVRVEHQFSPLSREAIELNGMVSYGILSAMETGARTWER